MSKNYNGMVGSNSTGRALGAILAGVVCAALSPVSAVGQELAGQIGIEAGISTLGLYLGPNYKINDQLTARVPLYFGSYSASQTVDGNAVNGAFDGTSGAVMADFHPFRGAFRVSGGLGLGGYELSGDMTNPVFEGTTYTGVIDVGLKQADEVVPILSIGYAKTFNNGFGVLAELGAKIGTYTFTASDSVIPAADKAQFNADVAQINSDLKALGATPFITLGLSYKF